MNQEQIAEVLAEHQRKDYRNSHQHCSCGWAGEMFAADFNQHQAAVIAPLFAAAQAEALREAADTFDTRSDTLMRTMQNMAGHPDTTPDDIVRYGAFSAESNTTAHWLRARADQLESSDDA